MTIGVLGLGRIGFLFAELLLDKHPRIEVAGFAPTPRERYNLLIDRSHFSFFSDWNEFFRLTLDGYVIASPSDTHFKYLTQLVPKEKPIFCEKPLDLSLDRIEQIEQLVGKHHSIVTVGFNRRFDPDVAQLKRELDEGRIGAPHIVKLTSRDPAPPSREFIQSSGGIFLDQIIHDYDLANFLLGVEPVSLFAKAAVLVDPAIGKLDDFDTAITTIEYANGCLVTIDNSRKAVYGYDQRIEAFGSRGMLSTKNHRSDSVEIHTSLGSQRSTYRDFFLDRYAKSYELEMNNFVSICQGRAGKVVSVGDAKLATKMAIAAEHSARNGIMVDL